MRPAYDSIYFDLKQAILDGTYAYKGFLPSEAELIKRYDCAHNTVRKAIAILAREGLVQPIHGKGVRVIAATSPIVHSKTSVLGPQGFESFLAAGKRIGYVASTKVHLMETITVDSEFSELTGFDVGDKVVHLERVRLFDGVPLARETNYFREKTVHGMTKEDAERSIYRYIEQERGGKLVTNKRVITVEPANEQDFELIEMGDATYVAAIAVATFDGEGLLCEVTLGRHHPEIFSYRYTTIRSRISSSL